MGEQKTDKKDDSEARDSRMDKKVIREKLKLTRVTDHKSAARSDGVMRLD